MSQSRDEIISLQAKIANLDDLISRAQESLYVLKAEVLALLGYPLGDVPPD